MPVSTFFLGLIQAVSGMFYMRPLLTDLFRLALHVIMLSGIGFLFIAEPVTMDYCIMIGSILLAVAGLNLAISNYSMSCLSGASSGMVMALLCGGFDESSAMGQILQGLYTGLGNNYMLTLTIMAAASAIITVRTFTLMPKTVFPFPVPEGYAVDSVFCGADNKDGDLEETVAMTKKDEVKEIDQDEVPPLSTSLKNPVFLSQVLFFPLHALRCYFFLGSVFKVLEEMLMAADRMGEIDHYLKILGYVLLLGFPLAPLSGTVIDFTMGFFVKSEMDVDPALATMTVHSSFIAILGLIYSLLVWTGVPELQYATFVIFVIHRSFTFSGAGAVMGMNFPGAHFGNLYGFMNIFSVWAGFGPDIFFGLLGVTPSTANLLLAITCAVSLWHPALMFVKGKQKGKN